MKAFLKVIVQCNIRIIFTKRTLYSQKQKENTGSEITERRYALNTDLNYKNLHRNAFGHILFFMWLNDYSCVQLQQLIYEHVAGAEVCLGPAHMKDGVKVNGTRLLWLTKH